MVWVNFLWVPKLFGTRIFSDNLGIRFSLGMTSSANVILSVLVPVFACKPQYKMKQMLGQEPPIAMKVRDDTWTCLSNYSLMTDTFSHRSQVAAPRFESFSLENSGSQAFRLHSTLRNMGWKSYPRPIGLGGCHTGLLLRMGTICWVGAYH